MSKELFMQEKMRPEEPEVASEQGPQLVEKGEEAVTELEENYADWHRRIVEKFEASVQELDESGADRMRELEVGSGLSEPELVEVRAQTGIQEKLFALSRRAEQALLRFGKKIEAALIGDKDRERDVLQESFPKDAYVRGVMLERDLRQERIIEAPLIREAMEKRNEILEARGLLSLSKEDFNTYFTSDEYEASAELKQNNVSDCYAVAAIHAFSKSPHFEMIVRSAMVRLESGTWVVRMPLLDENSNIIEISPDEISNQINSGYMKPKTRGVEKVIDKRKELLPLTGKEGFKVLEAAFIKNKFGRVDRLAAEGGWGDEVLMSLGGDNFIERSMISHGFDTEQGRHVYGGLDQLGPHQAPFLDEILEDFDPEVNIATVGTRHLDSSSLLSSFSKSIGAFKGKGTMQFFAPGHAYSVETVDKTARTVTVANPWNTANKIILTFEQFKGTFTSLRSIRVDNAKLLENMSSLAKKIA